MKLRKAGFVTVCLMLFIVILNTVKRNKERIILSKESYENIIPISKRVNLLKKGKVYFYQDGSEIIETDYREIKKLSDKYFLIKDDLGNEKLMDENNKEIILPANDKIFSISDGKYLLLESEGMFYYYDLKDKKRLSDSYKRLGEFREERALFVKDDKIGYIDNQGNEIIENRFDAGGDFKNGYVIVNIDGEKYRYIDKDGNISTKDYDYIGTYGNEILLLVDGERSILKRNNREYLEQGKILEVNNKFYVVKFVNITKVFSFKDNKYIKESEGEFLGSNDDVIIFNENGKIIMFDLLAQKEKKTEFRVNELEIYRRNYYVKREMEKSYLFDNKDRKLSKGYEFIKPKFENLLIVADENGYGIIDENGRELLECKFDSIYIVPDYVIVELDGKKFLYDKNLKNILLSVDGEILYINEKIYVSDKHGWKYVL